MFFPPEPNIYITQIKTHHDKDSFSIFVKLPSIVTIEPTAEDRSGITYDGSQMYFRGEPVEPVDIRKAIEQFLQFLTKFGNQPVVIVGHNIKRYGCYHLLTAAEGCGMVDRLRTAIHGFVDTCILFQKRARDFGLNTPKASEMANMIEVLYKYYFPKAAPYDPSEGARAVKDIVAAAGISEETLLQNFFSFANFECRFSWKPLERDQVITASILKRVAFREFHFDRVKQAFADGGEERAREVLQLPMQDGKPMVTDDQFILNKICHYLRDRQQQ